MTVPPSRTLGVFAKEPTPGRVKTRLAAATSPEWAAQVAEACLLDVVGQCKAMVNKAKFTPFNDELKTEEGRDLLCKHLNAKEMPGNAASIMLSVFVPARARASCPGRAIARRRSSTSRPSVLRPRASSTAPTGRCAARLNWPLTTGAVGMCKDGT